MPDYHIYRIDKSNRIVSRDDHDAPDDLAALEKARELCREHEVEAWQGTRLVARLAKGGGASLQPQDGPRAAQASEG